MRKALLAMLLAAPACVEPDTTTISGHWASTPYGGYGNCYEVFGGEDVHVDVHLGDGTTISETYACTVHQLAIDIPTGSTNVVVDVYGDTNDGRTHRTLGTVTSDVDLGACEIDATDTTD